MAGMVLAAPAAPEGRRTASPEGFGISRPIRDNQVSRLGGGVR